MIESAGFQDRLESFWDGGALDLNENPLIDVSNRNLYKESCLSQSTPMQTKAASSRIIQNGLGLHMRLAAVFVKAANKHDADIWVQKHGQRVNGKSILGLMTLAAGQGERIVISAQGAGAEKAVQELAMLVQRRFDEE